MKYKYNNQWKDLNVKVSDTYPIGAISPYGGSTVPDNWLLCDGSAVSRTIYADLFSIIGTTFGAGDGSTTFNIPDLTDDSITISTYIIKAFQSSGVLGDVVQTRSDSTKNTYACKYINELNNYSTNETIIGVYKGKPLYRKLIELTETVSASTKETSILLPLTNIANAWLNSRSTIIESNNVQVPFPNVNGAHMEYIIGGYIAISNGVPEVRVRKSDGLGILSEAFVVEYTKTTD